MLDELVVENLGLIAAARVSPGPGLVAVTGETGAGKTLLLGALRLLRGDPARSDRIGPAGLETRVEGRFIVGDEELAAARRLEEGRSRAYLDGSMVPRRVLEERLRGVVEIVAQHEHVALGRDAAVRSIVDAALDTAGREEREAYRCAWEEWQAIVFDRSALGGDRRALERELDLSRHQAREIDAAGVSAGEDAELSRRAARLRHAQEIAEALGAAHAALSTDGGALDTFGAAVAALRRAAAYDAGLGEPAARAAGLAEEAADLAGDLRLRGEEVEHDPSALDSVQQRLAVLADLRRKYGETLEEVVAYGAAAGQRARDLEGLLERADSLAHREAAAAEELASRGSRLAEARQAAGARLAATAEAHLRELGFRSPVLRVAVHPAPPARHGADRVELLFASDAALEPALVSRVASGGELSRLVLAVHLAAGVGEAPVVAFDEIDAGIGGATALAMGEKLAALAEGRQVLVVTHLPQVAAFAHTHLVVDREGSRASVRRVEGEDRLAELTRMLGGLPQSERGRGHAAELLAEAAARRPAG